MRTLALALLLVLGLVTEGAAEAFIVIVHAKNPVAKLDKKFVADAFLKKRTRWGDDTPIQPVDLRKTSSARIQFSTKILDRSIASVRTYWNQLVFSGRGVPPPEVDTDDDVIRFVAARAGAIGYVSGSAKLNGVKVIEVN